MTNEELQFRLNRPTTDIFIFWNDTPTMKQLLTLVYAYGYNFVNGENFSLNQSCESLKSEMESRFYSRYHGNSKPILHIYYNSLTKRNELQLTTQSVIKNHPQYKRAEIRCYFG